MQGYYDRMLSARKLERCYEIAPPRVKRYLETEVDFLRTRIGFCGSLLDLGCGYGRIFPELTQCAATVVGIDTSLANLLLAQARQGDSLHCLLASMNAKALGIPEGWFDAVVCIQNGISAFGEDRRSLVAEAVRVTAPKGTVFFSSYAESFWEDRLAWFRLQAKEGLIGEIDWNQTGQGVILCKDGFRAETVGPEEFMALAREQDLEPEIIEVDGSSLFCVLKV